MASPRILSASVSDRDMRRRPGANWRPPITIFLAFAVLVLSGPLGRTDDPRSAAAAKQPARPTEATLSALGDAYSHDVRPLITKYCLACHSEKTKKGDLNLERSPTFKDLAGETDSWQSVVERLNAGDMPPKGKPQPSAEEREQIAAWARTLLATEARARAGDPGRVLLRRLTNAEYDYTVRDLTGVGLRPARDFPKDGAAGEGFTNAGDGLVMSPVLLNRYWKAGEEIAAHAVFLPDGLRFSPSTTRADWGTEELAAVNQFYRGLPRWGLPADGRLPYPAYLTATIRHREALAAGKITIDAVATQEKLNAKYLGIVWTALTDTQPSLPLDRVRTRWRQASVKDAVAVATEVDVWQRQLWEFIPVGRETGVTLYQSLVVQKPKLPTTLATVNSKTLTVKPNLTPGQKEVVLYFVVQDFSGNKDGGGVLWHQPRLEGPSQTRILVRDVAPLAEKFDLDFQTMFGDTAKYLAAVSAAGANPKPPAVAELAKKQALDTTFLQRWIELAALASKARPAIIPADSVLAQWRAAAADPTQQDQLAGLAEKVQALLTGGRPGDEKSADRILFDRLVSVRGPLFHGIDLTKRKAKDGAKVEGGRWGLELERFGRHPKGEKIDEASLAVKAPGVLEVRLPAALFQNRDFVVEGRPDPAHPDSILQVQVLTAPPKADSLAAADTPWITLPESSGRKRLHEGFDEFRRCFPTFVCFPAHASLREHIGFKQYHREDEPLRRLFLDDEDRRELDRCWDRLRFASQYPRTDYDIFLSYKRGLAQYNGGPALMNKLEAERGPLLRQQIADFDKELAAAEPKQLSAIQEFAERAYRRPLRDEDKALILKVYRDLRKNDMGQEEALRATLASILISPAFLYRVEQPPAGKDPRQVSDWELATRLSYFLWASTPDPELRKEAAAGRFRDPKVLSTQVERMLKDPKSRGLASEFALQWLHVRDIQGFTKKNEKLFPSFDASLREAFFEEAVLFFQDIAQNDRSVLSLIDADHTFLNEKLAKHYGIPKVAGPQWRRVDGVRAHGRGGILTLGSVLTMEAGASRTSPVLRGRWVADTLLGEKLPKPPPTVPPFPDEDNASDELTVRQRVEKHTWDPLESTCRHASLSIL